MKPPSEPQLEHTVTVCREGRVGEPEYNFIVSVPTMKHGQRRLPEEPTPHFRMKFRVLREEYTELHVLRI